MVRTLILGLALLSLGQFARAAEGPTISGRLVSEDGMPLSGSVYFSAPSTCYSSPSGVYCLPGPNYFVNSDSDGTFRTPVITPNTYAVQAWAAGFLNLAAWPPQDQPRIVDLRDGVSVSDFIVRLRHGAELEVRVRDPEGLYFVPCASPLACSNLIVGVMFGSGAFLGAPRDTSGVNDLTYRLMIPFDQPFRLWVWTTTYVVTDDTGKRVEPGVYSTFAIPSGACKKRFVFNITGRAQ